MPRSDRAQILVVDDDPKIRLLMRRCFEQEGYAVSEAGNGAEMRARITERPCDLVTLDLGLPGEDGLTLAREIRSTGDTPIIMVTGKGDTIDMVVGLEMGADDYIAKPFQVRELLARVRAVLRRAGRAVAAEPAPACHDRRRFAGWTIDLTIRELRDPEGRVQELTTGEFNLLEVLVKHPNRILSRDELMDKLKGRDWNPLDRAIDTQVARLRKKLEPAEAPGRLIKTVRAVGYLFAADVERL